MGKAKRKHNERKRKREEWSSLDERTKEIIKRSNYIHNKGIGKSRGKKK